MEKRHKIMILAHGLRVTGGKTIGRSVLSALARVAPGHQYLITVPAESDFKECTKGLKSVEIVSCTARGRFARMRFDRALERVVMPRFKPDVIFALSGQGILSPSCPQALFPQDAHLFYPAKHFVLDTFTNKLVKQYHRHLLKRCLKKSSLIFCQTPVVEERIRKAFRYKEKAVVVYGAPSDILRPEKVSGTPPREMLANKDKLKFACVSAYYGHKNVAAIAKTVEMFGGELIDVVFFLTVDPKQHPLAGDFLKRISTEQYRDRIVNLGEIPHAALGAVYNSADALIMPTLLETFGLPYVEAMTFGLPILTSDLDFAHAVCADAAVYFDPWNPRSIRDAIVRFREDAKLRKTLAQKSRDRVDFFARSWDDITRTMVRELEMLVESQAKS
ncbi:MAG: glycosyltransferase family 4 protein [Phycisphaerae bacterium]